MAPVRILPHGEWFPSGDQYVDENFGAFVMNVIITLTVDQEKLAGETGCVGYW